MASVVIDGRTYRVVRTELTGGELRIYAAGGGPVAEAAGAQAAVFGDDGSAICRGWSVDMPAVKAGLSVTVVLPIRIDTLTTQPGPTIVRRE
jgi:hypothetical protein